MLVEAIIAGDAHRTTHDTESNPLLFAAMVKKIVA